MWRLRFCSPTWWAARSFTNSSATSKLARWWAVASTSCARPRKANQGTVIKTMGDEVMSTFPTADDAMNAAKRMQERITDRRRARSRQRPRRDPHRLPLRPGRPGAARHLRLGGAYGEPHDEPGQGQADHHHAGDGRSSYRPSGRPPRGKSISRPCAARPTRSCCSRCCGSPKRRRACCRRSGTAARRRAHGRSG